MKIQLAVLGSLCLALTGCSSSPASKPPTLGMANPASVYCAEQGGKLIIKNEANGQVGYCHLANGKVVEEWAFYRASQGQCKSEQATALIGQTMTTENDLKQKTGATLIRVLAPNQPATMDYRSERLTVSVEPKTKQILAASCG